LPASKFTARRRRQGVGTIGTTLEHPFFVESRGWTAAGELHSRDRIPGLDPRQSVAVAGVVETGRYERVYNLRVADYHTYFVGSEEWGLSVWAHNSYTALRDAGLSKSQAKRANMLYKTQGAEAARAYLRGQGFSGSELGSLMKAAAKPRTGAQRGPNSTSGHAATIRTEAARLEAAGNTILNGGGRVKEATVRIPAGGFKATRRPDILYQTPTGEIRAVNVGRMMADGVTPVPREVRALADLNRVYPTTFVPYFP
jgi:hypothetical protein